MCLIAACMCGVAVIVVVLVMLVVVLLFLIVHFKILNLCGLIRALKAKKESNAATDSVDCLCVCSVCTSVVLSTTVVYINLMGDMQYYNILYMVTNQPKWPTIYELCQLPNVKVRREALPTQTRYWCSRGRKSAVERMEGLCRTQGQKGAKYSNYTSLSQ